MNSSGADTVAARIAGLEFAVALLAKLLHEQGLANHAKIEDIMQSAGGTRAATVVKMLSAITELVAAQEATAAKEGRPTLCVVTPFPITATLLKKVAVFQTSQKLHRDFGGHPLRRRRNGSQS
jgi:uncharacterized membrane protein YgcG